jgi:hypothetical protein
MIPPEDRYKTYLSILFMPFGFVLDPNALKLSGYPLF